MAVMTSCIESSRLALRQEIAKLAKQAKLLVGGDGR